MVDCSDLWPSASAANTYDWRITRGGEVKEGKIGDVKSLMTQDALHFMVINRPTDEEMRSILAMVERAVGAGVTAGAMALLVVSSKSGCSRIQGH